MASNSTINNIYNYYLTTYAPKSTTKYDAHKKSELRGVYNSMLKLNKDDSVYIIDKSASTREFAIGIKEGARGFRNHIASLGGLSEEEFLNKKAAFSTNESLARASYIGENQPDENTPTFSLTVDKLASPQTNTGKALSAGEISLSEGTYSFDIGINGFNYEFQYTVKEGDTNRNVQEKLSRLINNTNIGLSSKVIEDEKGNTSIEITSDKTGDNLGNRIFEITDNNTSKTSGSVKYFGLDNVTTPNSDSEFRINGEPRHASANTFTVEKLYEVSLNRISESEEDSASITLQTDIQSMTENISKFVQGYNDFYNSAEQYIERNPQSEKLLREINGIAKYRAEDLSQMGLNLQDDGRFSLDSDKLKESVDNGTIDYSFKVLQNFTGAMINKANDISLNPMNYVDKTLVSYKNPGHNFVTPYVASPYTGMIFNSYC